MCSENKERRTRDPSKITGSVYPGILLDWSVLIMPSTVMVVSSVITVLTVDRIGRKALRTGAMYVIAVAAFVGIFFLEVPFPLIVLTAGIVGLDYSSVRCSSALCNVAASA